MKAWILDGAHHELRFEERLVPAPGPGQVLVKVTASGLCHSDVGYMEGTMPFLTEPPIILGHEAAGTIAALGEGVTGWEVGDGVVSATDADDAPGVTRDGAYAEYMIANVDRLVRLPEGIDWSQAATATDAGMTSHAAVVAYGKVQPGEKVLIVGLGGLGMVAAQIAIAKGAEVYGAEPREAGRRAALALGFQDAVANAAEYAGRGFDAALDFAGFGTTTTAAMAATKNGGRVVLVGMGKPEWTIRSFDLVMRPLTLQGATPTGRVEHLQDVIDMVMAGQIKVQAEEITFEEIPEGLERLRRGEVQGRLVARFA
ncbi:zinc-binding dehydrogenase [Streptomyces sp. NPDC096310]|uniref:zinc-binding dehydrogenase n=1 Tax=Streptomyces sp. NPDC096310 TaxID=3366082 RepID=UPI0038259CC7